MSLISLTGAEAVQRPTTSIINGQVIQINQSLQGLKALQALAGVQNDENLLGVQTVFQELGGFTQSPIVPKPSGKGSKLAADALQLAVPDPKLSGSRDWKDLRTFIPIPAPDLAYQRNIVGDSRTDYGVGYHDRPPRATFVMSQSNWSRAAQGNQFDPLAPLPQFKQPLTFTLTSIESTFNEWQGAPGVYVPFGFGTDKVRDAGTTYLGTPTGNIIVMHSTQPINLMFGDDVIDLEGMAKKTADTIGVMQERHATGNVGFTPRWSNMTYPTAFCCRKLPGCCG